MGIVYRASWLPATACVCMASTMALVATPADAFDFKISGQVDRAMVVADNGEDTDVGFVDNSGSNTRFRFTGSQDLDNGVTLGFTYEIGLGENASATFDINNGGGDENSFLDNRLANVYAESRYGKLTFGKLSGAADGTSEVDYSGTAGLGGGVDLEDYAAGMTFLDGDGNPIATMGTAFNEMDGLSRVNGIRYDTPSFGGAVLSASVDNGHAFELAARYSKEFDSGTKFGAALDYVDSQSRGRDIQQNGVPVSPGGRFQEYGGSASLLLPSGINFSGSVKHRRYVDTPYDDPTLPDSRNGYTPSANNYYGSVGYILGKNHFALSYDQTDDLLNQGSTFRGYGASYVYDFSNSIQLYASYHRLKLKDADYANFNDEGDMTSGGEGVDGQAINMGYAGIRLKFL